MEVYRYLDHLPNFKNPVLTIGTFDGVHIGHQKIIERILEVAHEVQGESILLTFHPHPRQVLQPDANEIKLINTLDERIELLEKYGIHHIIIATFTEIFSQTEPEVYVSDFLVEKIHPSRIVIGYDHQFGKGRKGDIELLKRLSSRFGYKVEEIPRQLVDDKAVSSTKIRKALLAGKIKSANELSGHPFVLSGKVIHGNQVGTSLGYPTANIFVEDKSKIIPGTGIYAAFVMIGENKYKSMMYIGYRPTFSGTEKSIEVNIFDFEGNLYNQDIRLELVAEIRGDMKFETATELANQMSKDKIAALQLLA